MRLTSWCVVAWSCAALAFAQEAPPEDGLGPFRFGMSLEAVQAIAPNASWRIEQHDSYRTLTGGPSASVGGARLSMMLVFQQSGLESVVLAGAATRSCAETVEPVVEDLELTYGAFHSMPPIVSRGGRISETRRTDMGSELRFQEASDDAPQSVHATQRRSEMFLLVSGEQLSPSQCSLTISFTRAAPISPEARDLFSRIDDAETITGIEWADRPSAADFTRYYPQDAMTRGHGGDTMLDCLILQTGRIECLVAYEDPAGEGFGPAAVAIAASFRTDVSGDNAVRIGRRTRVPIRFRFR